MDWLDMPRKIREVKSTLVQLRAVAQLGRAPGSGPGGRGFKSHQPDANDSPFRVSYCYVLRSFSIRSEAARREQYYKTGRGRGELDKL